MKLLFVHSNIFRIYNEDAYTGGQLNYEMFSNKYLKKFNNVLIASRGQRFYKESDIKNMSIANGDKVKYTVLPDLSSFFFWKRYFTAKKEIRKHLKSVDALTVRLPGIYSLLAIREAQKLNKPYFVEVVGNSLKNYWYHGRKIGKILAPISQYIMKREVKKSKYVIYVTQDYLQSVYKPKSNGLTTQISNVELKSVDKNVLTSRIEKINAYDMSTRYKVGLIGTYSAKYKGFDTAIEALSMLEKTSVKIDLHILGAGDNSWLKEIAKSHNVIDKVHFDGILKSGQEVINWLDDKDLYIHPSFTEGLPRSLIEAMSRGIPCIGSKVGGIPELLEPKLLHEAKDGKKLKELLYRYITDKEKLIQMSKDNFVKAQDYNMEKLSEKRQDFIDEFIEKELV